MPRYFFDLDDGEGASRDGEGTELPDLDAAQIEATDTLTAIGRERFRGREGGAVRIEVRSEDGRTLLRVELTYEAKSLI